MSIIQKLLVFISLPLCFAANFSEPNQTEAKLLDELIHHAEDAAALAETARLKAQDLKLKRLSRIILRESHQNLSKLRKWRSAYFNNFEEHWFADHRKEKLSQLEELEGRGFEKELIDGLISELKAQRSLLKGPAKTDKDFLKTFLEKEDVRIRDHLSELKTYQSYR